MMAVLIIVPSPLIKFTSHKFAIPTTINITIFFAITLNPTLDESFRSTPALKTPVT